MQQCRVSLFKYETKSKYVRMPVHAYFIFWLSARCFYCPRQLHLLSLKTHISAVCLLLHLFAATKSMVHYLILIMFWEVFVQTMNWWSIQSKRIHFKKCVYYIKLNINIWLICIKIVSLGDKFSWLEASNQYGTASNMQVFVCIKLDGCDGSDSCYNTLFSACSNVG